MLESIQKLRAAIFVSHPNHESLVTACCRDIAVTLRQAGAVVDVVDLYQERFDPVLTLEEIRRRATFDSQILRYQELLQNSDLLVFGHPDWWGNVPAILKGFVDRVFQAGVAFSFEGPDFERRTLRPLLSGRSALVVATTDREVPSDGEPIEDFWRDGLLSYCGVEPITVSVMYGTRDSRLRARKAWMAAAAQEARRLLEGASE